MCVNLHSPEGRMYSVQSEATSYSGGSRGAPRGSPPPLFWVKKEEITEETKAGWASKIRPGSLLSSKFGSATVVVT